MKFYYTTSEGVDKVQQNPANSIGGYMSSTPVPNGRLNSLFDDITERQLTDPQSSYIGLMLVNDSLTTVTGLKIWVDNKDIANTLYSDFQIALETPQLDAGLNPYIERLSDVHSMPFSGTFAGCLGLANAISIPDMVAGAQIGVWFQATPQVSKALLDYNNSITALPDQSGAFEQAPLITQDNILVQLSWN